MRNQRTGVRPEEFLRNRPLGTGTLQQARTSAALADKVVREHQFAAGLKGFARDAAILSLS